MTWKPLIGSVLLLSVAASCSLFNRLAPTGNNQFSSNDGDPSPGSTVESLGTSCLDQPGQTCVRGTDETYQDHTDSFGDGQYNHNTQRLLATFSLRSTGEGRLEGVATIEHTLTGDFDYVMCSGTYSIEPRRYEARLTGDFTQVPGTDQVYLSFVADPVNGPPPATSWETNCEVQPDFLPQVWEWSGVGGAIDDGRYDFYADWSAPDVGEYWQKVHMELGSTP